MQKIMKHIPMERSTMAEAMKTPLNLLNRLVKTGNNHKPGTCPSCGLGSYARMSDKEKRAHKAKHDKVTAREKAA